MSATFACDTCFDTGTIDTTVDGVYGEHACSACSDASIFVPVTIKLTGLGWGMGAHGANYRTASAWTKTTITFTASTAGEIRRDVARVRSQAVTAAKLAGERGRSSISSGAIAIERRVLAALNNHKENQS